jgi:hypothetical protein
VTDPPTCDNCEKRPAAVHILVKGSTAGWLCLCATCLPESWLTQDARSVRRQPFKVS